MTEKLIDELITITEKKRELLGQVYKFTKIQKKEIKKDQMEDLNMALDEKGKLIKDINELDVSFLTIFSQIKKEEDVENINDLDFKKYPNLKNLQKIIKEVAMGLEDISQIDSENNKVIKSKLEETKMDIRKIQNGKRAYKGYNNEMVGSILLDEKK